MTTNQLPPLPDGVTLEDMLIPLRVALETCHDSDWSLRQFKTTISHAIAALAQQAQEPVGVVCGHESSYHRSQLSVSLLRFVKPGAKLYTTPPAPQPAPVDEREAFEASMREKHGWVARDFQSDSFGYFDGHTATAWLAWQARAALQSPSPKTKGQP